MKLFHDHDLWGTVFPCVNQSRWEPATCSWFICVVHKSLFAPLARDVNHIQTRCYPTVAGSCFKSLMRFFLILQPFCTGVINFLFLLYILPSHNLGFVVTILLHLKLRIYLERFLWEQGKYIFIYICMLNKLLIRLDVISAWQPPSKLLLAYQQQNLSMILVILGIWWLD